MRRRNFLMGLGGLTVALPTLRKFSTPAKAELASGDGPRRIITMAYPMGTHVPMWRPSATGADFELGPITQSMAPFKDRALFVSNCPNAVLGVGGNGWKYGHPGKKESVLTGTLMKNAFGGDGSNRIENVVASSPGSATRIPNGPSVDHVIGQALRRDHHARASVDLGVWGTGVRDTEPSDFFYESAANPATMAANPAKAFAAIFGGVNPDGEVDEAYLALQRRKASVLDAVRDSFVELRQGLDTADRKQLDEHAEKIRQIEVDLPPVAACSVPDAPVWGNASMKEIFALQNRIMAHAMGCDLAPVGRIEALKQQNPYFGIPAIDNATGGSISWHHPIVHASDGWASNHPVRVAGFKFFVDQFADLCAQLDAIVEGPDGRTVLDNSLVLLVSDLAEGVGHSAGDLCFLAVHNSGPGRRGFHFNAGGHHVNRYLTTLIRMANVTNDDGSPIEEFGLKGFSTGVIPELLAG